MTWAFQHARYFWDAEANLELAYAWGWSNEVKNEIRARCEESLTDWRKAKEVEDDLETA